MNIMSSEKTFHMSAFKDLTPPYYNTGSICDDQENDVLQRDGRASSLNTVNQKCTHMWDFKLFSKASSLKPTKKELCKNKDRRPSTTHTSVKMVHTVYCSYIKSNKDQRHRTSTSQLHL